MDSSRRALQHAASFEARALNYVRKGMYERPEFTDAEYRLARLYFDAVHVGQHRKLASKKRQRGRKAR